MGKVEIGIYFCVIADILTKVLLKCFWSSPRPTICILFKSLILIGGRGNRKAKFSCMQPLQYLTEYSLHSCTFRWALYPMGLWFVCCLAHRGSNVGFILLQCSSGVVRHPGISRCRSQHAVSIESSSLFHHSTYLWFTCFPWWSTDELDNLHAYRTTNYMFWAIIEAEGEVGVPWNRFKPPV